MTPNRAAHYIDREKPVFHDHTGKEFRIGSRRYISAEIEVASAGYPPTTAHRLDNVVAKWSAGVVTDCSLGRYGFEINTAPARGTMFVNQIDELCHQLHLQGALVDEHCGCHIHVDARDFGYYDIKRLLMLYEAVEPALFMMLPAWRKRCRFCAPCGTNYMNHIRSIKAEGEQEMVDLGTGPIPTGRTWRPLHVTRQIVVGTRTRTATQRIERLESYSHRLKRAIMVSVYGNDDRKAFATKRKDKRGAERYRALNLHSWFYRHTLEFRMPEGSIIPADIIGWGTVCASLLDRAMCWSEKDIGEILKGRDPVSALAACVPSTEGRAWLKDRIGRFGRTPMPIAGQPVPVPDNTDDLMDALGLPHETRVAVSHLLQGVTFTDRSYGGLPQYQVVNGTQFIQCDDCAQFFTDTAFRDVYYCYLCMSCVRVILSGDRPAPPARPDRHVRPGDLEALQLEEDPE